MIEQRYMAFDGVSGRRLAGLAVPYGKPTAMPWGREAVAPGAFTVALGERRRIPLTVQHERSRLLAMTPESLSIESRAEGLWIEADLPETREADDALANIRAGVYGGLSIEFHCQRDSWLGALRTIQRATLTGISVVDTPAYPDATVEARMRAVAAHGAQPLDWCLL